MKLFRFLVEAQGGQFSEVVECPPSEVQERYKDWVFRNATSGCYQIPDNETEEDYPVGLVFGDGEGTIFD
jgi:hypothetical protein